MDRQMRRIDRQVDRQVDRQADRQVDRQADSGALYGDTARPYSASKRCCTAASTSGGRGGACFVQARTHAPSPYLDSGSQRA